MRDVAISPGPVFSEERRTICSPSSSCVVVPLELLLPMVWIERPKSSVLCRGACRSTRKIIGSSARRSLSSSCSMGGHECMLWPFVYVSFIFYVFFFCKILGVMLWKSSFFDARNDALSNHDQKLKGQIESELLCSGRRDTWTWSRVVVLFDLHAECAKDVSQIWTASAMEVTIAGSQVLSRTSPVSFRDDLAPGFVPIWQGLRNDINTGQAMGRCKRG